MKTIRSIIRLHSILFFLSIQHPITTHAQNVEDDIIGSPTRVQSLDLSFGDRYTSSVSAYSAEYEIDYRIESGLFFGFSHLGIEASLLQPYLPVYGSYFLGFAGDRTSGALVPDIWVSGISIGREFYFRGSLNEMSDQRVSLYMRAGPGIGLSGTGSVLGPDANYFFGFNGHLFAGMDVSLSDRTTFYIHAGGRTLWYPALDDIGFFISPYVSFGIRFRLLGGRPEPVRFR